MVFRGIGLSSKWKPVAMCLPLILPELFSDGVPNATGAVFSSSMDFLIYGCKISIAKQQKSKRFDGTNANTDKRVSKTKQVMENKSSGHFMLIYH